MPESQHGRLHVELVDEPATVDEAIECIEAGQSFKARDLLERLRLDAVRRMLTACFAVHGRDMARVAWLLGYSEQGARDLTEQCGLRPRKVRREATKALLGL